MCAKHTFILCRKACFPDTKKQLKPIKTNWNIIAEGDIISNKELQINEEIRDKEVRVVTGDGAPVGVLPIGQALEMAVAQNLDLVKIAPQANPPVCKIMDYGKYKFEAAKREKENRKNQKIVEVKEVRLSPSIDTHDFETKLEHAKKFLMSGNKVKVAVRFRGREIHHSSLGVKLLERFAEGVGELGTSERSAKMEGRQMFMMISPKSQ